MKYAEVQLGRTFVIRLEDGDVLHESVETFAKEKGVEAAALTVIGGADDESVLVTGPKVGRPGGQNNLNIEPMEYRLQGPHEVTGTGTIFPDKEGNPVLHMHLACGRKGSTRTGCVRRGVKVWHVMEIILQELIGTSAKRLYDPPSGFDLLEPHTDK